jgi:hypothetical protein
MSSPALHCVRDLHGDEIRVRSPHDSADLAVIEPYGFAGSDVAEHLGQRDADSRRHHDAIVIVEDRRASDAGLRRQH